MKIEKQTVGLIKKGAVVFLTFSITMFGIWWSGGTAAKSIYEPLVPQAEKSYQSALKNLCNAELTLVQAKIMDNANNALVLTPEQAHDLQVKRQDKKCDF